MRVTDRVRERARPGVARANEADLEGVFKRRSKVREVE
jgi:hypothetical protein